jgi:hypothetical protein
MGICNCLGRIAKFKGRMRRSKQIFGRHAFGKVFKVGILPSFSYGADMVYYGDDSFKMVDQAGELAYRSAVPFGPDALVRAWTGPCQRPSLQFIIEPILRCARAAWAMSEQSFVQTTGYAHSTWTKLTLHHLVMFSRVLEQEAYEPGTIAAILPRRLTACGLTLEGPYHLVSRHNGICEAGADRVRFDLSRTSPSIVKDYLLQLADRQHLGEAAMCFQFSTARQRFAPWHL